MKVKAPQASLFSIAIRWNKVLYILSIVGFLFSIFLTISERSETKTPFLESINSIVSFLALILTIGIYIVSRCYNSAKCHAEDERRNGLLDNSFSTLHARTSSEGYYDTDEIAEGFNKLLANIHENSLFTSNIVRKMLIIHACIMIPFIIVLCVCAYIGFGNVTLSPIILEVFLSYSILSRLLDLKQLYDMSCKVEDNARALWSKMTDYSHNNDLAPEIIKIMLQYEVGIATTNIILNESIYKKLNESLSNEWNVLKERYSIK